MTTIVLPEHHTDPSRDGTGPEVVLAGDRGGGQGADPPLLPIGQLAGPKP